MWTKNNAFQFKIQPTKREREREIGEKTVQIELIILCSFIYGLHDFLFVISLNMIKPYGMYVCTQNIRPNQIERQILLLKALH